MRKNKIFALIHPAEYIENDSFMRILIAKDLNEVRKKHGGGKVIEIGDSHLESQVLLEYNKDLDEERISFSGMLEDLKVKLT